jgi:acid phosphatase type 7
MGRKPNSSRARTTLDKTRLQAQYAKLPRTRHGHPFAPDPVPPGFHTIIDPDKHPPQPWRDLPRPTGFPPFRVALDSILDRPTIQGIREAQKLVFHAVGDTGGVNTPTYIESVSRFMENDLLLLDPPDRPSFFYHLGDVVYYDGESANYWPEFYEPYANYHAPIVAIPGNHDGDVNPATGEASLAGFVRNFCAQSAVIGPDNRDSPRRAMTQPNVYWTLNTPLVTIIGLYSNCPEGGQISDTQRQWLIGELKDADPALPIILTVHHPIYSAYGAHPGSTRLKDLLEESCAEAGHSPQVVLSGHVHNYQRFAAPLAGKQEVPFIVAGAGGYNKRLHALNRHFHNTELPIQFEGQPELLEAFNDGNHGYLRISVTPKAIQLDYIAVPDPSVQAPDSVLKPADSVRVMLP